MNTFHVGEIAIAVGWNDWMAVYNGQEVEVVGEYALRCGYCSEGCKGCWAMAYEVRTQDGELMQPDTHELKKKHEPGEWPAIYQPQELEA